MTKNQIDYANYIEKVRTDRENELIGWKNAESNARNADSNAMNAATNAKAQQENARHNLATESLNAQSLANTYYIDTTQTGETARHNQAMEAETQRHNQADELARAYQAGANVDEANANREQQHTQWKWNLLGGIFNAGQSSLGGAAVSKLASLL